MSLTGGYNFTPSLSGDGTRVAYVSTEDGDREIFLVNSDGTGVAKMTDNSAFDSDPSVSHAGTVDSLHFKL